MQEEKEKIKNKEAIGRLRRLANSNFENEITVNVNYDICLSKTDASR